MTHLGDRISVLVDGQLSPDAAERAHEHLAGCRACREAVETERLIKARLSALRDPAPGEDLMARLLALGGPNGPLPPRAGHVPGTPRPQELALPRAAALLASAQASLPVPPPDLDVDDAPARPVPQPVRVGLAPVAGRRGAPLRPGGPRGSTGPRRAGSDRRRTRLAVAVFGALSVVGMGITGLTVGSAGSGAATPTVVPPVDTFLIDHARTTDQLPFVDVPAGWLLVSAGQGGGAGR